jgi:lipopolysaccharide transport system permease protein
VVEVDMVRGWVARRALVAALVRRALIARYRGTALGFLWSFLHPLLMLGAYALVFGVYARLGSEVKDYPAFLVAGLLPWAWLAQGIAVGTTSILGDAPFARQAAFPPSVSALVQALAGFVNFALGIPVLLAILWLLGAPPTPWLLLLPVVAAIQLALLLGLTLALSTMCVRFRDTAQLVQAGLPILFLVTPIAYPPGLVPGRFAWLVRLNPLAHLADAFRAALLGERPDPLGLAIAAACALGLVVVGARVCDALAERIPEEL